MARGTYEILKVYWLPTVVNQLAPTVAEITAGKNLTTQIPVDGVEKGGSANNASQAMLGDAFIGEEPGTWGRTLTITFMLDRALTAADNPWEIFDYRTEGFLLFSPTGAIIATTKVEVWHVKAHERLGLASAENEYQKFTITYAVTEAPKLDAVIT